MKKVYIASPYRNRDSLIQDENVALTKRLCRKALAEGHAPFAPHLMYPALCDPTSAAQDDVARGAGLAFVPACEEVWIPLGVPVSDGMRDELLEAKRWHIPVIEVTS